MTTPLQEAGTIELTQQDLEGAADPISFVARQLARIADAVGHVTSRSLDALVHDAGLPAFL